jgi:hypothetical protein
VPVEDAHRDHQDRDQGDQGPWVPSGELEGGPQVHALRDAIPGSGQPTPQDYLEKIFQLPFWVQPLTDSAREQLVRGLLVGSVRSVDGGEGDAGDTTGLHVGAEEAELLEAMLGRRGSALRLEATSLPCLPKISSSSSHSPHCSVIHPGG